MQTGSYADKQRDYHRQQLARLSTSMPVTSMHLPQIPPNHIPQGLAFSDTHQSMHQHQHQHHRQDPSPDSSNLSGSSSTSSLDPVTYTPHLSHMFGSNVLGLGGFEPISSSPNIYGALYDTSALGESSWHASTPHQVNQQQQAYYSQLQQMTGGQYAYPGYADAKPEIVGFKGPEVLGVSAHESRVVNPGAISTDWLKGLPSNSTGAASVFVEEDGDDTPEYCASPLLSVSPSGSLDSPLRRVSESDMSTSPSAGKRKQKRKMTWSAEMSTAGPTIAQEQKMKELEELEELQAGGSGKRRERRRLQNRLAQRAFRARSKVIQKEVDHHLVHLERLSEFQGEKLQKMTVLVDRLQKENTALKAEKWARVQVQGGGPALGGIEVSGSTGSGTGATK